MFPSKIRECILVALSPQRIRNCGKLNPFDNVRPVTASAPRRALLADANVYHYLERSLQQARKCSQRGG
jgi:hypothetical protein